MLMIATINLKKIKYKYYEVIFLIVLSINGQISKINSERSNTL